MRCVPISPAMLKRCSTRAEDNIGALYCMNMSLTVSELLNLVVSDLHHDK